MLRSVYLKTLRDMRWGVLGWGIGIGILGLVTAIGWSRAYPDEAARASLATEIHTGLSVAQAFYGPASGIDRLGGFLEWRVLGLLPVLIGIYVILAATGMTRGAEESHVIEAVVATPLTRSRVLIEQTGALATGLIVSLALSAALIAMSGVVTGEASPGFGRLAAAFVNVTAAALFFGAIALLAGQFFARRRTAAMWSACLMVVFHLLNTLPLVTPALHLLRYASPLYLYTLSTPLANGHIEWPALAGLVALSIVVGALALLASRRRDFLDTLHDGRSRPSEGESLADQPGGPAARRLLLRNPFLRSIRDAAGVAAAWAVGIAGLSALFAALVPNMRQALLEGASPGVLRSLERAGGPSEKAILSLLLGFLIPPLVSVFGVTLAASWAGDELSERLELELSVPVPRRLLFLERFLGCIAVEALVVGFAAAVSVIAIEWGGVDVPVSAVWAGAWTLVVLATAVAAFGFAVAGWRPALVTALGGGFVVASYFGGLVIPLLGLPSWVRYFSVFSLYGSPIGDGVTYWRVGVLLALAFVFAGVGAVQFQRRDIVK